MSFCAGIAALAAAAMLGGTATPAAGGQEPLTTSDPFALAPPEVQFATRAADSILTTPDGVVSLEAFDGDTVTGVYLRGSFDGRPESVGYGLDHSGGRHYLWFSIGSGDSVEYVAMLFDVDRDLTPEFLLFRTIDHATRTESATEYRAPSVTEVEFDITFQPACVAPRCDPSTWTLHPRERVAVPAFWFSPWRPLFGVAAMRGERWIGRPVAALSVGVPDETP